MRPVPAQDAPQDWRADPLQAYAGDRGVADLCRELRAAGVPARQALLLETAARQGAARWPGLADPRTGQLSALLDFDLAGPAFRVQDLAAALLLSGALDGPNWQHRAAALVRGHVSVLRLDFTEIRAVPDLLLARCVGSALWRPGRWRRGQARLGEVVSRLHTLDATMTWLTTSAGQLTALMESGQ